MSKDIADLLLRAESLTVAQTKKSKRRWTAEQFAKAEDDARQIIEALPRLTMAGMEEIAKRLDGPTLVALMGQIDDDAMVHIQALKKFRGRKKGSFGPVRKAIAKYLKAHGPDVKNPEIWNELFAHQPRGLEFFDNREGMYVEWRNREGELKWTYRHQFESICGEERRILRAKIRS